MINTHRGYTIRNCTPLSYTLGAKKSNSDNWLILSFRIFDQTYHQGHIEKKIRITRWVKRSKLLFKFYNLKHKLIYPISYAKACYDYCILKMLYHNLLNKHLTIILYFNIFLQFHFKSTMFYFSILLLCSCISTVKFRTNGIQRAFSR